MEQSRPVSNHSSSLNPERRLLAQIDRSPFNHIKRSDVPARASDHPTQIIKVQPKYALISHRSDPEAETDIAQEKTAPPSSCVWQYETPRYQAESTVAGLSLAVDDAIASPETLIDEVDTVPVASPTLNLRAFPRKRPSDISEIRTSPPLLTYQIPARVAQAVHQMRISEVVTFRPLSERKLDAQQIYNAEFLYPWDRLRWWLLRPGRIEYLCWLVGTVLLLCFTAALFCAVLLSLSGNPSFSCLF